MHGVEEDEGAVRTGSGEAAIARGAGTDAIEKVFQVQEGEASYLRGEWEAVRKRRQGE